MTREEIIERMKVMAQNADRMDEVMLYVMTVKDMDVVREAAEMLTARPAKHIHEEYPEHEWERQENGEIDEFAMDVDNHNGPMCVRCWESFCVHCEPDGYETHKHCVVDKFECPECGKTVYEGQKYCAHCGRGIVWDE